MQPLLDWQGNLIKHGSLITWNCEDFDDCKTWKFYGIVHDYTQHIPPFCAELQRVIYMGGGIDFGAAVGKELSFQEVIDQSEDNEPHNAGIRVIGTAHDVVKLLGQL